MNAVLIGARALHFAALISVTGVFVFLRVIAEPAFGGADPAVTEPLRQRLFRLAWMSAGVALASGALWLVLEAESMSGQPLRLVLTQGIIGVVLAHTQFGWDWLARLALGILLVACLVGLGRCGQGRAARILGWALAALGAAMLAGIAWAGHAGAVGGMEGALHLAADALHLVAAGAWLGALVPLAWLLAEARHATNPLWAAIARTATHRFSTLGIVSVGSLLVTGIANTWFLAWSVPGLVGTPYGRLLLLKIGLFLAMICVAAVNRFRLTPRLSPVPRDGGSRASDDAIRQLRRNSLVEAGLGLAILAIVGGLGTLPPALHTQPIWPFPVRFSAEILQVPELRAEVILAIAMIVVGSLLILGGILLSRFRWPTIILGLGLVGYFAPSLTLLTVEAFPTSFYASPTGYSVAAITQGEQLFAQNCASCHGTRGQGHGPAARGLKIPPADLTADHIYAHTDGDLFWWISNGLDGVMPGFADVLDERARWDLIDFIHANADARRVTGFIDDPAITSIRAPNFMSECADGSTLALQDLRGRIVHIILAGSESVPRLQQLAALDLGGDVSTLVLAHDMPGANAAPFCTSRAPEAVEAYALYRGVRGARSDGTEFLVDTAGRLRAVWYPDFGSDWTNPEDLKADIEEIRRTNSMAPSPSPHVHIH